MSGSQRVAVLVVRAWAEDDPASSLRARVTWVDDVEQGDEQTAVAAGAEDVLALVRRWLESISADNDGVTLA